jgi:AcrR family transcriptional regulator
VSTETSGRKARTRRTGEEVRSRLIEAARDVFAERGYAGASTREIATRAEVTEVLLFRHFGSKAGLFEHAVLDPFDQFVNAWASHWSRRGPRGEPVEELARDYIELLYDFFDENRQLVVALLAAKAHHPPTAARLDELFQRLESTVREGSAQYGFPGGDPAITVRLTFGLVMSSVLHADLLFPTGSPPTRDELVDELTRYMWQGLAHPFPARADAKAPESR